MQTLKYFGGHMTNKTKTATVQYALRDIEDPQYLYTNIDSLYILKYVGKVIGESGYMTTSKDFWRNDDK